MPRHAAAGSIDLLVEQALGDAARQATAEIARLIGGLAEAELVARLEGEGGVAGMSGGRRGLARRRAPRSVLTRWAADRRARRVPSFVIELTRLKTKKQIIARYGADAVFRKGKPAPRVRR